MRIQHSSFLPMEVVWMSDHWIPLLWIPSLSFVRSFDRSFEFFWGKKKNWSVRNRSRWYEAWKSIESAITVVTNIYSVYRFVISMIYFIYRATRVCIFSIQDLGDRGWFLFWFVVVLVVVVCCVVVVDRNEIVGPTWRGFLISAKWRHDQLDTSLSSITGTRKNPL